MDCFHRHWFDQVNLQSSLVIRQLDAIFKAIWVLIQIVSIKLCLEFKNHKRAFASFFVLCSWPLAVLGKLIPVSDTPFAKFFTINCHRRRSPSGKTFFPIFREDIHRNNCSYNMRVFSSHDQRQFSMNSLVTWWERDSYVFDEIDACCSYTLSLNIYIYSSNSRQNWSVLYDFINFQAKPESTPCFSVPLIYYTSKVDIIIVTNQTMMLSKRLYATILLTNFQQGFVITLSFSCIIVDWDFYVQLQSFWLITVLYNGWFNLINQKQFGVYFIFISNQFNSNVLDRSNFFFLLISWNWYFLFGVKYFPRP